MQDERDEGRSAALFDEESAPPKDAPGARRSEAAGLSYRVLARKYRPSNFDDLIGQEAMVRTLSNAFDLGRIHQAYMLTGVRGVGKTTTARILARAFNYELPARPGREAVARPTIHMGELGVHCQAIIDSRHVDVIEMDAASHTGIDDVREIIEGARYKPAMARYKVYLIDEVHMLSKQAFNGLLKTLEEPPDHVKFLFATTEIEKVPVTVRSRCQRFDLRRVEAGLLASHLGAICAREHVAVEDEALALIARAAEGSVRDALSLLDQAIAHGAGLGTGQGAGLAASRGGGPAEAGQGADAFVSAEALRAMLGLADRGRIIDLFEQLMGGAIAPALAALKELYDGGADPAAILIELAEFAHLVTRLKLAPAAAEDAAVTPQERLRGARFAATLSMATLTRTWQLLAKGMQEVRESPRPLAAADMVLVRLAYAADLPTPDEALRKLAALTRDFTAKPQETQSSQPGASWLIPAPGPDAGEGRRAAAGPAASPVPFPARVPRPSAGASELELKEESKGESRDEDRPEPLRLERFEDVVALAGARRDIGLKSALERDVRLVRFENGHIEFSAGPHASAQLAQTLTRRLQEWTGRRWIVALSREEGRATLKQEADRRAEAALQGVKADPLVRRALDLFPGAEIVAVRLPQDAAPAQAETPPGDEDLGYFDEGAPEADF